MYRYCPNCGEEYVATMTECIDCAIALVSEPPPETPAESDPLPGPDDMLVEVYGVARIDAHMVRAMLEGNGIPAVVSGGGDGAYPVNVGAGASQVLVARRHAQAALELIREAESGGLELGDDDGGPGGTAS